jgi:hypothetical protein
MTTHNTVVELICCMGPVLAVVAVYFLAQRFTGGRASTRRNYKANTTERGY